MLLRIHALKASIFCMSITEAQMAEQQYKGGGYIGGEGGCQVLEGGWGKGSAHLAWNYDTKYSNDIPQEADLETAPRGPNMLSCATTRFRTNILNTLTISLCPSDVFPAQAITDIQPYGDIHPRYPLIQGQNTHMIPT